MKNELANVVDKSPTNGEKCNYTLSEDDVEEILDIAFSQQLIEIKDARRICNIVKDLHLVNAHRLNNHVRCVSCTGSNKEGVWFEKPKGTNQRFFKISCPVCQTDFCSECNKTPYHFGCDCDSVVSYAEKWLEWISPNGIRDQFVKEQSETSASFKESMQQYESQRKQREEEVRLTQSNLENLRTDEVFKESFCRICPHCRV